AADRRVVEVEVGERDTRRAEAKMPYAARGEVRTQLAVFHHALRVVAAERHVIEIALREREDLRLRLLDDADLDAADRWQRFAAHAAYELLLGRVGVLRKDDLPIIRIRLQH